MNKFSKPAKYDLKFSEKPPYNVIKLKDKIFGYKWNNKLPTSQMLGRFQPWHRGHGYCLKNINKDKSSFNYSRCKGIGTIHIFFK